MGLVLLAGAVAGFVNVIVGGGSMFSLPALVVLGLPEHVANGTNRFGVIFLAAGGVYKYRQAIRLEVRTTLVAALVSTAVAPFGALLSLLVPAQILRWVIGSLTLVILASFLLNTRQGLIERDRPITRWTVLALVVASVLLGLYGGFLGIGVSTLYMAVLVVFFGMSFLESAATTQVIVFSLSVGATVAFAAKGQVDFTVGIPLAVAMAIGGYLGALFALRVGNQWVKRIFAAMVLLLVIRLLIP